MGAYPAPYLLGKNLGIFRKIKFISHFGILWYLLHFSFRYIRYSLYLGHLIGSKIWVPNLLTYGSFMGPLGVTLLHLNYTLKKNLNYFSANRVYHWNSFFEMSGCLYLYVLHKQKNYI